MPTKAGGGGGGYAPVKTVSRASDSESDAEAGFGEEDDEKISMYAPDDNDGSGGENFGDWIKAASGPSAGYCVGTLVVVLVLVLAVSGDGSADARGGAFTPPVPLFASCELRATTQSSLGAGLASGTMYLTYTPGVGTDVEIEGTGMSPGKHGVHIHALGDLSDSLLGVSTGGHYNPHGAEHGCAPSVERKAGDLGNMLVNSQGEGFYAEQRNPLIKLHGPTSIVGRSLIVHALEDNCAPVEGALGDLSAGARIALCTVGLAEDSSARALQRAAIQRGYARAAAADAASLRGLDSCSWLEPKLPPTIHPLAYSLVLEPGLDGAEGFSGEMSTTISVSAPTSCVVMHARRLQVTGVTIEQTGTAATTQRHVICTDATACASVVTDIGREMVSISTLPVHFAPGSVGTLVIQYTGEYTGGMYISAPSPQVRAR
jgi:Cu-Zn family superoxide dismutase